MAPLSSFKNNSTSAMERSTFKITLNGKNELRGMGIGRAFLDHRARNTSQKKIFKIK